MRIVVGEFTEALATLLASVGVVAAVNVSMLPQVTGRRERLGAVFALVWFHFLVRHAVVVEVGAGGEALATDLALVRLLARVDATVRVE